MTNYMIIRHIVEDFSVWKPAYDEHITARESAGLTEKHLLRDTDDANMITIIFEAEDLNRAKDFTNSEDLREVMQKIGVGKPEFYFLNDKNITTANAA